ncbi:MAG: hypothetical protein HY302_14040 [Opitutae bacterium]|nr:hypothetical protein [Opitutae bacterium]
MKDHRFLELLNLYIDRQISPAETAELEAEIQGSPRRQKVYREYCQMHRATKLVYESFRQHGAEPAPGAAGSGGAAITHLEIRHRRRRQRWISAAGGLAAAACLTFVVARIDFTPAVSPAAATDAAPAVQVAAAPAATTPVATARNHGLVSLQNGLVVETDYPAMLAALRQQDRALPAGQMPAGRLQPLFDDGVFDHRQVLLPAGQRIFRGHGAPSQQPAAEFAAFQFQR